MWWLWAVMIRHNSMPVQIFSPTREVEMDLPYRLMPSMVRLIGVNLSVEVALTTSPESPKIAQGITHIQDGRQVQR